MLRAALLAGVALVAGTFELASAVQAAQVTQLAQVTPLAQVAQLAQLAHVTPLAHVAQVAQAQASEVAQAAQVPQAARDAGELALAVNRAIAAGVENLRRGQLADGHWPGQEGPHPGGMTALACFTLVKSGVKPSDECVRRALAAVQGTTFRSTYSHAVRLLLFDALREPATWREPARSSLEFLIAKQDGATGGWAYPDGGVDMSNTQFALLGLRAARRLGLEVPNATWVRAANGLLRFRDSEGRGWAAQEGGFKYWTHREASGGMTAATLAGLAVLGELAEKSSEVHVLLRKHAKSLEASEQWLARRFRADGNPVGERAWTPSFQFAYLWAVERFGGLTGRDRLGERDWYTDGATWLVDRQKPDGGWGGWHDDTCFALLFLRKATLTVSDAPTPASDPLFEGESVVPPKRPKPDAPRIVDWWVAGPFADKGVDLATPPFDPAKVRARDKAKVGSRAFERLALVATGWSDLDQLTKRSADQSLWLLATTLANSGERPYDVELWLSLEDGWSVWLDGQRISFDRRVMAPIEESVRVPFELSPGEHGLVIVLEDLWGAAAFGARIVEPGGAPPGAWFAAGAVLPKARK